jgi:hypothetical protein
MINKCQVFLCFVWLKVWSFENLHRSYRARHEYFQLIPAAPHPLREMNQMIYLLIHVEMDFYVRSWL